MDKVDRALLTGNEAIARACLDAGVELGAGYPGTPSTEILESFSAMGGRAQWAPNEKVATEVGLGVAFGNGAAVVTMKHVGLNVAADTLYTATHTGVTGALVLVVADDPGMHSSQNEQDTRRHAIASGTPVLEPADSQEAYDYMFEALEMSHKWGTPVILRTTTRVNHSRSIVTLNPRRLSMGEPFFKHDRRSRVMVPGNARPAHKRMRQRLSDIGAWSEQCSLNRVLEGGSDLGIIASGVAAMHAREAAPGARLLKLGASYPPPIEKIREFAAGVKRCLVVEEGDPVMFELCRVAGVMVEGKPEMYRFGELDVNRVRRIVAGDTSPESSAPGGKPPQLCQGCPHRATFDILHRNDMIVSGDIGCYTLGVMPPYEALDSCVCMGAAIGVGLGLRHVLPEAQARRVVSVIGDSTFVHSGITGLAEMVYNPPSTGHVVVILDNGITAMTGMQEHPGTGRRLDHSPTGRVVYEDLARAMGVPNVVVIDPQKDPAGLERAILNAVAKNELWVIIARSPCILVVKSIRQYEKEALEKKNTGGKQE